MADFRKLNGVPWHVETLSMADGDQARHKARCIYRDKGQNWCSLYNYRCIGSSHCDSYDDRNKYVNLSSGSRRDRYYGRSQYTPTQQARIKFKSMYRENETNTRYRSVQRSVIRDPEAEKRRVAASNIDRAKSQYRDKLEPLKHSSLMRITEMRDYPLNCGDLVVSRKYGSGIVTEKTEGKIRVRFENEQEPKSFLYPDAFLQGYLFVVRHVTGNTTKGYYLDKDEFFVDDGFLENADLRDDVTEVIDNTSEENSCVNESMWTKVKKWFSRLFS